MLKGARPTAHDVVNTAIRENRAGEVLLYSFAGVFVLIGVLVVAWSLPHNDPTEGAVGVATSLLFMPAVRNARQIRKENIMIRLLEVPLSRSETADEAAKILTQVFERSFRDVDAQAPLSTAEPTK